MASLLEFDYPDSAWNLAVEPFVHGDPFCCRTEWQLSFHEAFAPDRKTYTREHNGSLISFAAHTKKGQSPQFEPIECSWLFGCPLLGKDALPLLAELIAQHPKATVLISGMDVNSALTRKIITTFGMRHDVLHIASDSACRASLDGGIDGYLGRRSAKTRRGVRHAQRKAKDCGVYFERHAPENDADADQVYARILAVEGKSWKGIRNVGMNKPPSSNFYALMLRRMAAGSAGRVIFARHEDTDVGFIFGGLCGPNPQGNIYRGQQFSFVEDWRTASLGNLLQLEQLTWLCEEGVARYDMGPAMEYKHHWTEQQARLDAIALRPC
jgi:hypothetical protein